MTSASATKRGRPRLHPAVRVRIIQIRAFSATAPPSYDAILDQLAFEGWPTPSRGSVQNVVNEWESLPDEVRVRDLPFAWQDLSASDTPWEASSWILACKSVYEFDLQQRKVHQLAEGEPSTLQLRSWEPFTNRWAAWCWRVHRAAMHLEHGKVLVLADKYVHVHQQRDLAPDATPTDLAPYDAFLQWRPDLDCPEAGEHRRPGVRKAYDRAAALGLAPVLPRMHQDLETALTSLDLIAQEPPPVLAQAVDFAVVRQLLLHGKETGVLELNMNVTPITVPDMAPAIG